MQQFAFVFPGQGSQSIGMLQALGSEAAVKAVFDRASDILGYDVWNLIQNGPLETLNKTQVTQPVLLAANYAVWECWRQWGGAMPAYLAGHSLGEFSALVAAEVLDFEAALQLVANRGQYMQEAVPEGRGAMAAIIGLDNDVISSICEAVKQDDVVSPANYNSIGQTVIAGNKDAVERAVVMAKDEGAKLAKLIPVSVPSHCALMQPAAAKLADDLSRLQLQPAKIPVIQNVDVAIHTDPDEIRDALEKQLTEPVRWVETIEFLASKNVKNIVECGPGKVLMGLNKRITKDLETHVINTPELLNAMCERLKGDN